MNGLNQLVAITERKKGWCCSEPTAVQWQLWRNKLDHMQMCNIPWKRMLMFVQPTTANGVMSPSIDDSNKCWSLIWQKDTVVDLKWSLLLRRQQTNSCHCFAEQQWLGWRHQKTNHWLILLLSCPHILAARPLPCPSMCFHPFADLCPCHWGTTEKNHAVVGERMPVKSPHLHGCGRNESVRHWLDLRFVRTCQEKVGAFAARTPSHHCSQWMHKCLQHWTCHLLVCLHVTAHACIIMLNKHAWPTNSCVAHWRYELIRC